MKTKKIVLIGGPGTGKTTLIQLLKKRGNSCLSEISRQVIREAQKNGIDQLFLKDPLKFSELLLKGRIKQFQEAEKSRAGLVFIDRGIPDVSAYMDYGEHNYPENFIKANKEHRYDKVFYLPLWKEIYLSDNERYESFSQAKKIEKFIVKTYEDLGYELIEVPKATPKERIAFILKHCS